MSAVKNMTKFTAYFGTDIKGLSVVTRYAFEEFCKKHVDNWIDCYTVTNGDGVWKGTKEKSFILTVIVEDGHMVGLTGHRLAEAAEAYNIMYAQECVFLTRESVRGWFV